jgi:hypothetical protein
MDDQPRFRTSSYCANGTCVEIAIGEYSVELRDVHDRRVVYSREEWRTFIAGAKAGEFDA